MKPHARRLLFICTGNVCRSVMAEFLAKALAKERGTVVEARSCGLYPASFPVPDGVRKALAREGIGAFEHTPKVVSAELLAWADLALTATRAHRDEVVAIFPQFSPKVQVLRTWAGLQSPDVKDPIGLPDEDYAKCLAQIRQAVEVLV